MIPLCRAWEPRLQDIAKAVTRAAALLGRDPKDPLDQSRFRLLYQLNLLSFSKWALSSPHCNRPSDQVDQTPGAACGDLETTGRGLCGGGAARSWAGPAAAWSSITFCVAVLCFFISWSLLYLTEHAIGSLSHPAGGRPFHTVSARMVRIP